MTGSSSSDDRPKKDLKLVLQELKQEYLAKLPKKISHLKTLTDQQDWLLLEEEYHNLKGTGKTYGFPEISSLCERLEILAQRQDPQNLDVLTQAITLFTQLESAYRTQSPLLLSESPIAQSIFKRVTDSTL